MLESHSSRIVNMPRSSGRPHSLVTRSRFLHDLITWFGWFSASMYRTRFGSIDVFENGCNPAAVQTANCRSNSDLPDPSVPVMRSRSFSANVPSITQLGRTNARAVASRMSTPDLALAACDSGVVMRRDAASNPAWRWSAMSLMGFPWRNPAGGSYTVTSAPYLVSDSRTCLAWLRPASSRSAYTATFAPARWMERSSVHFPAPPELVVAMSPTGMCAWSTSAHFSPSATWIFPPLATASITSGSRYRTRRTPSRFHAYPDFAVGSGRRWTMDLVPSSWLTRSTSYSRVPSSSQYWYTHRDVVSPRGVQMVVAFSSRGPQTSSHVSPAASRMASVVHPAWHFMRTGCVSPGERDRERILSSWAGHWVTTCLPVCTICTASSNVLTVITADPLSQGFQSESLRVPVRALERTRLEGWRCRPLTVLPAAGSSSLMSPGVCRRGGCQGTGGGTRAPTCRRR